MTNKHSSICKRRCEALTKLVDQVERNKITADLTTNFLVEAGAGSGKTYSLVQRMANIISSGTYQIREMVAITFTRKAADELKERFQSELERRRKVEIDPVVKKRLEQALVDFDQCYLGTVHSFCARLLRERPVEAGLDFDFTELDEQDDKLLAEEAWSRYIQQIRLKEKAKLEELSELGIDIAELRNNLHHLREFGDVVWQYDEAVEKPSLDVAFAALKKFINDVKSSLPAEEPDKGYDSLQKKVIRTIMQLKYYDITMDKMKVAIMRPYQKASGVTLNRWKDNETAKLIRDEMQPILAEVIDESLKSWFEYCHSKLIPFLKPALLYYQQLKKERSLLNFQDLLSETARLLKENSEVRQYFQQKYGCLLVDEFQDTDPIQAEMMMYLTGVEVEERDWTKLTPKAGSLFVVGDPKQSIYRFRRADIDIYQRVKKIIDSTGGEVLHLTMNFRTERKVTEPLNFVFQKHLPEVETTYQAAYRPLNSVKNTEDEDPLIGLYRITVPNSRKTAEVVTEDADRIARYIRGKIDKNEAEPKDFMVLTRYNGGLEEYAKKLEEYAIPVLTTGEISLSEDEEIRAFVVLLRLLANPTNSLLYVAVLRGQFFGLSDRLLYEYSRNSKKMSVFTSIPEELTEEDRALLSTAQEKLLRYLNWRNLHSPTAVIEKVLEDIGILSFYVQGHKSKREYLRLWQVIEKLRAYEANGHTDFHLIIEKLTVMVDEETMAEMTMPDEENAVRVMNVHKSKGLEAPIVFLAHPKKFIEQKDKIDQHIKREGQQSLGYFCFRNEKGELIAQPPIWEKYHREEYEYLLAEEKRLVYVAATRAEKMLVISSMDKSNEKNNPWNDLIEVLDLPELEVEEIDFRGKEDTNEYIAVDEFREIRSSVGNWEENVTNATYHLISPSVKSATFPYLGVEREKGGGTEWGNAIHAAFEASITKKDKLEDHLLLILKKYQLPLDRLEELRLYVQQYQQSSIYYRLEQAVQWYTELPFSMSITEGEQILEEAMQGDVILTGIIDLIFKEKDGWVIVDYKSDRIKNERDAEKLKAYYQQQLKVYEKAWEKMTGEKVKETLIYFVALNEILTV